MANDRGMGWRDLLEGMMDDKTMLKLAAVAAAIVAIAGCTPTMREQAEMMECSVEQSAQVIKHAEWCSDNAGYLSTYCYDRATVKLCSKPAAAEIGKGMGVGE